VVARAKPWPLAVLLHDCITVHTSCCMPWKNRPQNFGFLVLYEKSPALITQQHRDGLEYLTLINRVNAQQGSSFSVLPEQQNRCWPRVSRWPSYLLGLTCVCDIFISWRVRRTEYLSKAQRPAPFALRGTRSETSRALHGFCLIFSFLHYSQKEEYSASVRRCARGIDACKSNRDSRKCYCI
jgi:hypothetical protein